MKFKKLLATVTAVALATSTMAFSVFAAANVTAGSTNDCGGTHNWVNGACANQGQQDSSKTCDATCDHAGDWNSSTGICNTCKKQCDHAGATLNASSGDGTNHTKTCVTCGKNDISEACTPASSYVNTNSAKHWKVCSVCSVKITTTEAEHDYSSDTDTTCDTCGYERTVSTTSPATPTGTKVEVKSNTWTNGDGSTGGNWQGTFTPTITGITNGTSTVAQVTEALDSLKLSFKINGAISNDAVFDTSKITVSGILKQPSWGNIGSVTKAADGTYTLTIVDVDSALADKSGTVEIVLCFNVDLGNASQQIDVYISDVTVDTTKIDTTSPKSGSELLDPASNNGYHGITLANSSIVGTINPSTGVLKLKGSAPFGFAYCDKTNGWKWTTTAPADPDHVEISESDSYEIPVSKIEGDVQIFASGTNKIAVNWVTSINGAVNPATPADPNASSGGGSSSGDSSSSGSGSSDISDTGLTGSYTGSIGEGDAQPKIPVTIVPDNGKSLSDIRSVTVSVTFADGTWGGGCLGMNVGGNWTSSQWDNENGSTVTIDTPNGLDSENGCEFQIWWLGGTGSISYVITYTYSDGTVGGGANVSAPANPSTPAAPSAPSAPSSGSSYEESPVPSGASSITMVDSILASVADSVSFNLGSNTKLDKEVIEAIIANGDITVKFNVSGGAYWEIDSANITNAKAVDLGVRMNGTLIPESKVSELAGDKTTIQLSLRHNGDFGFTGVLNVPINRSYNGKYANLYYYNGGKFDFVGSSAITGGRAKFAFSHASNYLIVIDDYAYGEDVSSAAGMTETETTTETSSTFPYAAVLVVISAFGISAIVLKKRLSK